MDATRRIYRNGAIAIVGNRIHSVGQDSEISGSVSARETLDGNGFVITPGFVNCHVHITGEPLTRGIVPDNTDWAENVFGWLIPMYMTQTPADERLSAQFAALEMLRTGTTTFIEAGTILNLEAVADGLAEIGIRGRIGQWLQDRAFAPDDDQTALPDSALSDLARTKGLGVSAHMSADPADPEYYLETAGKRAIAHLADLDALGPHLSLTHAVHLDQNEVDLLASSGTHVTHCPMTAMKGGYGASSAGLFPEMAAAGVNIQLGTDGNNNGNTSDIMRAMFAMAGLFKDARRDASLFSAYSVLEAATINGAKGAQMADQIGSLEPGKKADFVLHDRNRPEWVPLFNPVNQLIYSADGRGVHSVWVDGRRVVENYRSTLIDEDRLLAEVQAAGMALVSREGRSVPSEWPVL